MAEVKKDLQRYREVMRQLPKVEEFSDEEVENMSGKASQLLGRGKLRLYTLTFDEGFETALHPEAAVAVEPSALDLFIEGTRKESI